MIPCLRSQFNSAWTPAKYAGFLKLFEDRFGEPSPFRQSETPVFLTKDLVDKASQAGVELVHQLLDNPAYMEASHRAIPESYHAPNDAPKPLFVQADFGLDQNRDLKLVEIQGFPSLYGYQLALAEIYRQAYQLDPELVALPDGLSGDMYNWLLREAIVGNHNPENVALLEIDPLNQKTRHDFAATHDLLGIAVVDARSVIKQGNRLFYNRSGTQVPIERIYNRVIADELDRRQIKLPFEFRDELDVEWAGHPNWFFDSANFRCPFSSTQPHPTPSFSQKLTGSLNLQDYVLKPLYSFAGSGVVIGPTQRRSRQIPSPERAEYLLQERVNFSPCIETRRKARLKSRFESCTFG